jgi:chromosome segregation ATPase
MPGFSIEKRLTATSERLRRARVELSDVTSQLELARHQADEARTDALVQGGAAKREATASIRSAERLQKSYDKLSAEVAELTKRQDDLLDKLPPSRPS